MNGPEDSIYKIKLFSTTFVDILTWYSYLKPYNNEI